MSQPRIDTLNKVCESQVRTYFAGRTLVIATKHKKEAVIAPLFENALGVKCMIPHDFDTDSLGTFSGEVERRDDPIITARKKCLWALSHTGFDLAIASEGSFGPHPAMMFTQADEEWMMLIDKKYGWEIVAREISLDTNFNGKLIKTEKQLIEFAENARFPTHGLILRNAKDSIQSIHKGLNNWELLTRTFHQLYAHYQQAYIETDMRAMYNPTRMHVIKQATEKLVEKIKICCPSCYAPGYSIQKIIPGLPCGLCGMPTRSPRYYVYRCLSCSYEEQQPNPDQEKEDPMYCQFCNP